MRSNLILMPLLLGTTPVVAQPVPQLPPELTDPATAQRVTNAMQAVSNAFLDMRVGEVQAALEGRPATPQEQRLTVRDLERRKDFDRRFQHQLASVGPKMQQSMQAVNQALPAVMQSLEQAQRAIERAVANMPDPTYPRR